MCQEPQIWFLRPFNGVFVLWALFLLLLTVGAAASVQHQHDSDSHCGAAEQKAADELLLFRRAAGSGNGAVYARRGKL